MSDRRLFAHELEEQLDALLFASPSHRSISRLASLLEALPRPRQNAVLHWAGIAARTYAEIGYLIATQAPRAFEVLGDEGFEAWVLAGLDTYDKEGLRPAMERLRDLDGLQAERAGLRAARLADVEPRLTRFVQGLSGRPLALKAGEVAWTDSETLYLPQTLACFAAEADNRALYKVQAALLWAQTRFGTFQEALAPAIAAATARGERAAALGWLIACEAVRLEECIARELPGLAAEIACVRGEWPASLREALPRLTRPGARLEDSLAVMAERLAAGEAAPTLPHAGTLDPEAALRTRAARIATDSETLRRALAALKGAAGRKPAAKNEFTASVDAQTQQVGFRCDGEAVTLPPEAQAAAQSLVQDLGQLPPQALTPAGDGAWQPTEHRGEGTELVTERPGEFRYDEWDYHRQAYRRQWCHVFEHGVAEGQPGWVGEVRARHAALIRQIRRRFEILRGEDRILSRQPDGEDIDLDAQVEAIIDRRCGAEPAERLFMRRQRNERSLAAMFMVDMSGSTKGWVNEAEREALVMLGEALQTLGDAYAIYGFSGWTRTRCDIYRIKTFADAYDETVQARIAGIEAKDYTRMGFAIRHLSRLLAAQPARHKLLVMLSDGRPDDFGDEYRGAYGIEDTRHALQEAREQGIRSYCVTIDRQGADYLRHMVGPAGYTVLDDVRKLPLRIAEIYRRLTTG